MKKNLLPLLAVIGGLAGFSLRLLQNLTGFEGMTGLPVRGAFINTLLPLFLVILFVILILFSRNLPQKCPLQFPIGFQTDNLLLLSFAIGGIFLMGISGALELASSFTGSLLIPNPDGLVYAISPRDLMSMRIGGMLSVFTAVSLFPAAAACRKTEESSHPAINSSLLLIPTVCMVVRLVLCYRSHSINPVLASYYVELLALLFLCLGFYRLSSFAFCQGNPRIYALYSVVSVVLALVNLADGITPSSLPCLGGALTLLSLFEMQSQESQTFES